MDFAYYVGEGSENKDLMEQALAKLNGIRDARKALIAKYSADQMMVKGKYVYGLAWKAEQHERWKHLLCERDGYYVYNGDKRYKKGKELYVDMHDVCVVDDIEEKIAKKLGVDHLAFGTKAVYYTFVGWNKGHILVKIPDDGNSRNRAPKPPDWFREITLNEWKELCITDQKEGR